MKALTTLFLALAMVVGACKDGTPEKKVSASKEFTDVSGLVLITLDGCEYVAYYGESIVHKGNCKNHTK